MDKDTLRDVLDGMDNLLRHVAAGFVAVACVCVLDEKSRNSIWGAVCNQPWVVLFVAVVIGLVISAIHRAALYHVLCWVALHIGIWVNKKYGTKRVKEDLRRWELRGKLGEEKFTIQREIDRCSSFVHFLYCSGWAILGASVYLAHWGKIDVPLSSWWCQPWCIGAGFLFAALVGDVWINRRELARQEDEEGHSLIPH
jgi:hypothetical protein